MKKYMIAVQDKIEIILTKFKVQELIHNTYVDVFDSKESENGYQRPINEAQKDKLYEYLKLRDSSVIPTSIILCVDSMDDVDIGKDDTIIGFKHKLRVIDGQHRIAALKKYIEETENDELNSEEKVEYEEFLSWEYPVNILILDKNSKSQRYIEARTFVDINKKGKTVSTDLAETVINKLRNDFTTLHIKHAVDYLSMKLIENLISNKKSMWYDSIKEGDKYTTDKIIGVSSFKHSIIVISRAFLIEKLGKRKKYEVSELKGISEEFTEEIIKYWNGIAEKWEDAFSWDIDICSFRVDSDYNIQKVLGVSSLHKILKSQYNIDKKLNLAVESSLEIIRKSDYESIVWRKGGTFSSHTSSSGHNKIKELIMESALKKHG